jgi:hypothetical protein
MRTTINLDADVEAAVERLRRERGWGLSEAVNELARRGAARPRPDFVYQPVSFDLGVTLDVTDVDSALGTLDDWDARS